MRIVSTKLRDSEYEKLKEIASKKGMTIYQFLGELIRKYISKEFEDSSPFSDISIEARVRKLEFLYQKTREELEELARDYERLKKRLLSIIEELGFD